MFTVFANVRLQSTGRGQGANFRRLQLSSFVLPVDGGCAELCSVSVTVACLNTEARTEYA